jgi:hypothetical protein
VALLYVLADGYDRGNQRVRNELDQEAMAARTGKTVRQTRSDLAYLEGIGAIERSHRYRKRPTVEKRRGTRYADEIRLLPDPSVRSMDEPSASGSCPDYRKSASSTTGSGLPDRSHSLESPLGTDPCGSFVAGATTSGTAAVGREENPALDDLPWVIGADGRRYLAPDYDDGIPF